MEDPESVLGPWRVKMLEPFLGIKHAAPVLRANGGSSIVNVCSMAALVGIPNQAAYTMSQSGLRGLTKAAALEWGRT